MNDFWLKPRMLGTGKQSMKKDQPQEQVNHPQHYNQGSIEVIDVLEDWALGFHEGNVVKYVARAAHKGNQLQDLQKARWYLDRKIKLLGGESWNKKGQGK